MQQIEQTYIIKAPIANVWRALTDASLAKQWGAAPAKVDAHEGGEFSYWDGDIHGINTKVIPERLLEQDWYGHNYPERCYKVSFTLQPMGGDTTTVILRQANVPDEEFQDMADGWPDYYFKPIKKLLEKEA